MNNPVFYFLFSVCFFLSHIFLDGDKTDKIDTVKPHPILSPCLPYPPPGNEPNNQPNQSRDNSHRAVCVFYLSFLMFRPSGTCSSQHVKQYTVH